MERLILILKDIIGSGRVETVILTEVFRQAQESLIVVNAHRLNRGEFPQLRPRPGQRSDFYYIEKDTPEEVNSRGYVDEECLET